MNKYKLQEYLIMHWDVPLGDFSKPSAHMEYKIQERKYIFFWKTLKTFTCKKLAEQEFNKLYINKK